jgi:hypothetical protein
LAQSARFTISRWKTLRYALVLRRLCSLTLIGLVGWSTPALAFAGGPQGLQPSPSAIYGGEETVECAWPTVPSVQTGPRLCTGALVHPRLVVFGAHCEPSASTRVRFGEDIEATTMLDPELCEAYPDYLGLADQAHDWAFCRLSEAVDLPTTPILFGCEEEILVEGADVSIVGFGHDSPGTGAGTKRWGSTTLTTVSLEMNTARLGGDGGPSICPGDSGGPGLIRLADGSWRAWGIGSTTENTAEWMGGCGGPATYGLMRGALPWLEERSGIDLTPCFDADGSWHPSPLCENFYAGEPGSAFGDYATEPWCLDTPASGASESCGAPYDSITDEQPPTVSITSPLDQSVLEDAPAVVDIEVDAFDEGWGVARVHLEIDGQDIGLVDAVEPYVFAGLNFPGGTTYTLVAVAEDHAGLVTSSEPVEMSVGATGESESDSTGAAESEASTDTGGEEAPMSDAGVGGCTCATPSDGRGGPWGGFLALVWFWRRSTRSHSGDGAGRPLS